MVINKFVSHFSPRKDLTVFRHKFFNWNQDFTELINNFYTDLVNLSLSYDLKEIIESLLCDVLLSGLNSQNQHIKEWLLRETDLILDKALAICKAAELTEQHVRELDDERNIHHIGLNQPHANRWSMGRGQWGRMFSKGPSQEGYNFHQQSSTTHNLVKSGIMFMNNCHNCGKNHVLNNCRANGKVCYKCGKRKHFANFCKSSKKCTRFVVNLLIVMNKVICLV